MCGSTTDHRSKRGSDNSADGTFADARVAKFGGFKLAGTGGAGRVTSTGRECPAGAHTNTRPSGEFELRLWAEKSKLVQQQLLTCALADDGSGGRAHSRAGVRGSEGTEAPEELLKGHPNQGGVTAHHPGEAEWFGHSSALSSTLAGGGWGAWEGRIGRGRWCPPLPRSPQRVPALFKNRIILVSWKAASRSSLQQKCGYFRTDAPTHRHTETRHLQWFASAPGAGFVGRTERAVQIQGPVGTDPAGAGRGYHICGSCPPCRQGCTAAAASGGDKMGTVPSGRCRSGPLPRRHPAREGRWRRAASALASQPQRRSAPPRSTALAAEVRVTVG